VYWVQEPSVGAEMAASPHLVCSECDCGCNWGLEESCLRKMLRGRVTMFAIFVMFNVAFLWEQRDGSWYGVLRTDAGIRGI
jgi:hypothetical protein